MNKFQNSASAPTRRNLRRFVLKITRESKAFPCCEFDFERCVNCYHVRHHLDELFGIEDCTEDELYKHHGNQPLIYTSMVFDRGEEGHWNGLIHYTSSDIAATRKFIKENINEIKVALAYEDPFTGLYHFVVETCAKDLSDENFFLVRKHLTRILKDDVTNLVPHHYNFYVRALPETSYDIINRDILFGPEVPYSHQPSAINLQPSTINHQPSTINLQPLTIINRFCRLFKKH